MQLAFEFLGLLVTIGFSEPPNSDRSHNEAENPCVHIDQPRDMFKGSATAALAQAEFVLVFECFECISRLRRSASLTIAGISREVQFDSTGKHRMKCGCGLVWAAKLANGGRRISHGGFWN